MLLLLTLLLQAGLQPGTGIVTGTVFFTDGQPAAAVRVAAITPEDTTGSTLLSIAETDAAGRYRLTNVPQGSYYIVAGRVTNLTYYPGFSTAAEAKEVSVQAATIVPDIDMKLPAVASATASRASGVVRRSEVVAYLQINLETNIDKKLKMLLTFQYDFPQSDVLPEVFSSIMDTYSQHRNAPAAWYSQKLLKEEASLISLFIQTSSTFAKHGNLDSAQDYAEQAVAAASVLQDKRPPVPYDGPAWESWARSVHADARRQLLALKPVLEESAGGAGAVSDH